MTLASTTVESSQGSPLGQLLLVRHGQTTFGDEVLLSPLGWEQGRLLGAALAPRVRPTFVVRGATRAHRETVEAIRTAAAWDCPVVEDSGWDEDDQLARLDAYPSTFGDHQPTREEFQEWLESAALRWTSGRHDEEYAEPWVVFGRRVDAALQRAAVRLEPTGTGLVLTSGGPLACVVAGLLAGETAPELRSALWSRLNRAVVSTSVTKIAVVGSGARLVSFNEHGHLEDVGVAGSVRTPAG